MKKVLVTGGTGFIGQHCLIPLLARGFEVHTISRKIVSPFSASEVDPLMSNLYRHEGDLLNSTEVRLLLQEIQPTHLLHLAWNTTHGLFWSAKDNLDWVAASLRLIRDFYELGGRRFVGAGSCAEYEWGEEDLNDEISLLNPSTLYGRAKYCLWQLIDKYSALENVSAAWGRVFFLYGPGENQKKLVASAIQSLLSDEVFQASHGRQIRDFLHVADVAGAFVQLLDSDCKGPVNISSGQGLSIAEVLKKIACFLGREGNINLGACKEVAHDPPRLVGSINRLRDEVKFHPQFDINSGLIDTVEWWKASLNP